MCCSGHWGGWSPALSISGSINKVLTLSVCLPVIGRVASFNVSSAAACTVSSLLIYTASQSFRLQLPAVNRHLKLSLKPLQE